MLRTAAADILEQPPLGKAPIGLVLYELNAAVYFHTLGRPKAVFDDISDTWIVSA